jgi:hypothetical protein
VSNLGDRNSNSRLGGPQERSREADDAQSPLLPRAPSATDTRPDALRSGQPDALALGQTDSLSAPDSAEHPTLPPDAAT